MYEVIVLKEGYNVSDGPGQQKACGSITLLKGPHTIIVDTGNPWDKDLILEGLKKQALVADNVDYVVCTNGHSDKIGNLNLFSRATYIISYDISKGDHFILHHFAKLLKVHASDISKNRWHLDYLLDVGLRNNGLTPENIEYCICTHGHSDHVGNLNLFISAIHIVSYDVCVGDQYIMHDFQQGIPYEIDEHVEVIPTPGHTGSDVSVLVKNTSYGAVAVTGDLFECVEDLDNPHLWQDNSEQPQRQERSRIAVLRIADYIVPGHGAMFQVPDAYKKQLRVVMVYEEHMVTNMITSRNYDVWEVGDD